MQYRQQRDISIGGTTRALLGFVLLLALPGCFLRKSELTFDEQLNHFQTMASQTQYPEVEVVLNDSLSSEQPLTLDSPKREPWWLSPEEAVQLALANSPVLRELGGQVLQAPYASRTIHNPAIIETDPRFGVEAALSAFDAEFFSAFYAENNDYVANNQFLGGGTNKLQQDRSVLTLQMSKRAATGTEYYLRSNTEYDSNNAPGNLFPSVYNTNVEAEFRHPLLQGSGVEFNRIAGPGATPGNYNGVVIARINADVSLLDFELGVRDLVNNVENAYWDLYFAYRDLESKVDAREATRTIWEEAATRAGDAGRPDLEPQAREQYFRYKEEVQNALSGRVVDGTRSNNGSSGGTFRGWAGVQVAERRLRLLMGAPINDHQMIVPTHEPFAAEIVYDWTQISGEAVARRAELRRQRLLVKRREMELCASRNFLLPRMDAFGRYRYRGFGDDLLHPDRAGRPEFDNAFMELTSGEYQEWRFGAELRFPIGFRQAHAGVRNAQLLLAREKSVLVEQERQVIHDLSNSVSDIRRAYETLQAALNRRISAQKQVEILNARKDSLNPDLWINAMLDALQRVTEATIRYHGARVEYILAVKNLHLEKGSLLEYNNVFLAENLPSVVAPSNGPDAPPAGIESFDNGVESVGPGTVVPETTNEGIRGPEFETGPAATPPAPSSAQGTSSPTPPLAGSSPPTPLAVDLRVAREAAVAAEDSPSNAPTGNPAVAASEDPGTIVRPRVAVEHPTDGRPPIRPGEFDPVADAPEAPRAQIRDMWGPGRYADPSVAVPQPKASESPAATLARGAAETGVPTLPATTTNSNRFVPPTSPSIPPVPETSNFAPPQSPVIVPKSPEVPPPAPYVPPAETIRNGGGFLDPSVAVPDRVQNFRPATVAPSLVDPAKVRQPVIATPESTAANLANQNTVIIVEKSRTPDATSSVVARPAPTVATNTEPAVRVAAQPRSAPPTVNLEPPVPPSGINTPVGMRRTSTEFRGAFGDPSVLVPSRDLPRVTVPPVSNRRTATEPIDGEQNPESTPEPSSTFTAPTPASAPGSGGAATLQRLPATRRVVPASRQVPLGAPDRQVNQADFQGVR